jgi:methylaspartate ammonia-lyase
MINEGHTVWCDYRPDPDSLDPVSVLQDQVAPLLKGQPIDAMWDIMAALDGLTETAVLTRPLSPEKINALSRRRFLTGSLDKDSSPQYEQVKGERPLSPALRYCVSQLLLEAAAAARGQTMTELIAAKYQLSIHQAPIPLHLAIQAGSPTPDMSILAPPIQSIGYTITGSNPQAQLGSGGEKLQRFIRQLTKLLSQVTQPDYRPAIHLDLAGGLGELFDYNDGRILGAIYGLEQAAAPYPLRISDPIYFADVDQQIKKMRQLKDYLRMRRLNTQLAANLSIHTVTDVERFVERGAVHLLEISLPRLGTVRQSMQAVQICRQAKMPFLLRDGPPAFAGQFALATQPHLIMAAWEAPNGSDFDRVLREMVKTITILTEISA